MRISDWSSDVCSSDLGDAWDNGSLQVPAHPPRRAVPDGRHRGARQADVLLSRCNARPPPSLPRSHAMSQVTFHGNPVRVDGRFPVAGEQARPFTLVGKDLADVSLSAFKGKRKLLNIFPSVDTGVCATALRRFNELASKPANAVVLGISADLPFAQERFCGAERSEERRAGKECVSTCSSRWSPYH